MNKTKSPIQEAHSRDSYWVEKLKFEFALKLNKFKIKTSLTSAELARKLRKSPPYISRVLKGDENLTIESMVKLCRAVGANLKIELVETESVNTNDWTKKDLNWIYTQPPSNSPNYFHCNSSFLLKEVLSDSSQREIA
jgi:transcriptional regulator with XRE-family HTH domain